MFGIRPPLISACHKLADGGWTARTDLWWCKQTGASSQDPGDLARSHAALQAKDGHSQFNQLIKPVADAIAAPGAQLRLA
jgi:hypothetical protein